MSVDFVESMTGRGGSSGSYQAEASEGYPIRASTTKPFFPAVCLKSHWDPTAMLRRIVPQGPSQPLPTDFRPWVKVCMDYTTSGPTEGSVMQTPTGMVFGPGGEFYPNDRYAAAINNESLLRRLDRPLGTCDEKQYEPNRNGDMYNPGILVPRYGAPSSKMVSELAMPRALIRPGGGYECRARDDKRSTARAQQLFNNPTKQQRFKEYQLH